MTTTLARTNRYPANCIRCGSRIAAEQGLLAKDTNGKWAADHPAECPAAPAAPAATPVARVQQDGIYRTEDGTIYKVQIAKQGSGNLYAKRLTLTPNACGGCERCDGEGTCTKGTFTYAPGIIHTLRADQRLDAQQARTFGKLYGICCACGADLTDEKSVALGIGPICGKRYF